MYKNKKSKITLICILAGFLISVGLAMGYLQYSIAYVKCGQVPVMTTAGIKGQSGYYTPEDEGYYGPDFFGTYYCTPEDAEADGVGPSPLSEDSVRRQTR